MIQKLNNLVESYEFYLFYNIKLVFAKDIEPYKRIELNVLFKNSFYSLINIHLTFFTIWNFAYLLKFEFYQQKNLTNETLLILKKINYLAFLLNNYPLNQILILSMIILYITFFIGSYKLGNFVIGEPSMSWKAASVLGFISFFPYQICMLIMNFITSYFFTSDLEMDHWVRQAFASFNFLLLIVCFFASLYIFLRICKIVTNLNKRKSLLVSILPFFLIFCILVLIINIL